MYSNFSSFYSRSNCSFQSMFQSGTYIIEPELSTLTDVRSNTDAAMIFLKIALFIVFLILPTTNLNTDMIVTLFLDRRCVQSGQTVYMRCCNVTDDPVSWNTSITGKKTPLKDSGLPNTSFVNVTGECQWYKFTATLNISGTVIYCLYGQAQSNSVTVQVTTGYIDDVQVWNYTSEVHGNNVDFNFTLVPKDTVCPVENPLNYSAVVSGHLSQAGALQIKNDSGYVLLLGVTVLYDHIRSLLNVIFSITFYYDQGKSQSIRAFEIDNPMYTMKNSSKGGGNHPGMGNNTAKAVGGGVGGSIGALLLLALLIGIVIVVVVVIKKYCCKRNHEFDEGQPPAEEPKTTCPNWATEQPENVCKVHTKETGDDNRCNRSDPKAAALRSPANGDEMKLINASEGGANGEPDEIAEELVQDPKAAALRSPANGDEMKLINASEGGTNGEPDEIAEELVQATTEASSGGTSQFVASQI